MPDEFSQLKLIAERHGMHQVVGRSIGCVRFESGGVSVDWCGPDGTYDVVHPSLDGTPGMTTLHGCPSLVDLDNYLTSLGR
jgi:hypothetical protein